MRKYRKGIKDHPRLNELSNELESQRSLERREGRTEKQKQQDRESARLRMQKISTKKPLEKKAKIENLVCRRLKLATQRARLIQNGKGAVVVAES